MCSSASLQEAFFGKELVDASREEGDEPSFDLPSSDENPDDSTRHPSLGTTLTSPNDDPLSFPSSPPRPSEPLSPPPKMDTSNVSGMEPEDSDKEHNIELGELNEILPSVLLNPEDADIMGIFEGDIENDRGDDHSEVSPAAKDEAQALDTMLHSSSLDPTGLQNLDSDLLPKELAQIDSKTLDDILKDDDLNSVTPSASQAEHSKYPLCIPHS